MTFHRFVKETTIHGFAEWYRAGACGKIMWAALVAVSVTVFGFAISSLIDGFISKQPVSSENAVAMEIPPFGLKVSDQRRPEYSDVENIIITGASPDENALVKAIIKGQRFVENQSFNVSGKRLTELLDAVYTKPEAALTLKSSSFGSEAMKKYARVTNVYNFVTGRLTNRLSQVIEFNSSVFLQPDTAIWIRPNTPMCKEGRKYGFWAGSEAFHGETSKSVMGQMSCGSKYIIQLGVTRYRRDSHYCNPDLGRYGNKLSCKATCLGRKQAERGCGIYVHSMIDDAVVRPCDPARWAAEKRESPFNTWEEKIQDDCRKECTECAICKIPCDEIRVAACVRDGGGDVDGSHTIEIYFRTSETMTLVETTVKVTSADLLSSIGGTLGLCIGASLLSVVHVLYFLFETIRCKRGKRAEPEDIENA